MVFRDIFGQKLENVLPLSRLIWNGSSSMKVLEEDCVWNKMCLTSSKLINLNAPSTDVTEYHPIRVKLSIIVCPTWRARSWKNQGGRYMLEPNRLNSLQMVQLECPKHWISQISASYGYLPFSFPLSVISWKLKISSFLSNIGNLRLWSKLLIFDWLIL